jgi:hypothetical protein
MRIADILLAKQEKSAIPSIVGKYWINNFVKHHDKLESKFSCKYDYKQVLYKNPKIIRE